MWADNTWDNRRRIITRFTAFRQQHSLMLLPNTTDWAIVLFVISTGTAASTQLSYLKDLAALHRRIGFQLPICTMMSSALSARGGLIPEHQATPATEAHINHLLIQAQQYGPRLVAAMFLMWKTASRFDDVARIIRQSLISCRPIPSTSNNNNSVSQLVIAWADRTKSTRRDPFRASSWTVIHHDQPMEFIAEVIRALGDDEPLLAWNSSRMVQFLRDSLPEAHLTAHSSKRGALSLLFQLIAEGRRLPMEKIPLLAKHKTAADFPAVTLRYSQDAEPVALALGTQLLTAHIPCRLPGAANLANLPSQPPSRRPSSASSAGRRSNTPMHDQMDFQQHDITPFSNMLNAQGNMMQPPQTRPASAPPNPRRRLQQSLRQQRRPTSAPAPQAPVLNAQLPGTSIRARVAQRRAMQELSGGTSAMRRLNALLQHHQRPTADE